MEKHLDSLLTSYEEEIAHLDSQQWEQNLPRVSDFPSQKKHNIKSEMIDVDLVRGSTFPKSKTRRGICSLLLQSTFSLLVFPFQYTWWRNKSNKYVYLLGCIAYFSCIFNVFLHFCLTSEDARVHSDSEILEPVVMFGILLFLQSYIHCPSCKDKSLICTQINDGYSSERISSRRPSGCEKKTTWTRRIVDVRNSSPGPEQSYKDLHAGGRVGLRLGVGLRTGIDSLGGGLRSGMDNLGGLLCSDADSTEREIFSDADSSLDHISHISEPESEHESLLSESEPSPPKPRIQSREWKSKQFKNSRENSHGSNSRISSQSPAALKIGCTVWNSEEPSKVRLSAVEIGSAIFERSRELPDKNLYAGIGVVFAVILAAIPAFFKYQLFWETFKEIFCYQHIYSLLKTIYSSSSVADLLSREFNSSGVVLVSLVTTRLILLLGFFFLLGVAERAFKRRFLIAKLFSQITSTRRAKKSRIPHFRLYKVRNIKAWLCVRSFLRRRGPKRSIDLIVSVSFMVTLYNVMYICYHLLKEEDQTPELNVHNCEAVGFCLFIGCFLIRFITLASRINQKYLNPSVLLTEQINLYLRMEEKPHKKDQLILANNVLKLSTDLIKELDRPCNILGLSANPLLYNIVKLLVLSAVSGALSEMLGFKLKLYKVKLR